MGGLFRKFLSSPVIIVSHLWECFGISSLILYILILICGRIVSENNANPVIVVSALLFVPEGECHGRSISWRINSKHNCGLVYAGFRKRHLAPSQTQRLSQTIIGFYGPSPCLSCAKSFEMVVRDAFQNQAKSCSFLCDLCFCSGLLSKIPLLKYIQQIAVGSCLERKPSNYSLSNFVIRGV